MIRTIISLIFIFSLYAHSAHSNENFESLVEKLSNLNTKEYTGGLPSLNRSLSESIVENLRNEFPKIKCEDPDFLKGVLVSKGQEDKLTEDDLKKLPLRLQKLVTLLNSDKQEVRDTVIYTLAKIGPSARKTLPFIEAKKNEENVKGGWFNYALTEISCEDWIGPSYEETIPNSILTKQDDGAISREQSAALLAKLFLDKDVEFPPKLMSENFDQYSNKEDMRAAELLLIEVLNDPSLSEAKKGDVIDTLLEVELNNILEIGKALDNLEPTGEDFNWSVEQLYLKIKHKKGLDILNQRIKDGYYHWSWYLEVCSYGKGAVGLDSTIIERVNLEEIPSTKFALLEALGCIQSPKGMGVLVKSLKSNDWQLQKQAALSMGGYSSLPQLALSSLMVEYNNHWSKQVRDAAKRALIDTGHLSKPKGKLDDDEDRILIKTGPVPVNHGLAWCDESGEYSIDGKDWFKVEWQRSGQAKAPEGFPEELLSERGTRVFHEVEGGWLYGSELGHYDGDFVFWSKSKGVQDINQHADIYGIVEINGKILAFGYEVLANGDGGSLFEIFKNSEGYWDFKRLVTLPSPPFGYAISKEGHLLLTDVPNDYAVIENQIVPLKCTKQFAKSYFD